MPANSFHVAAYLQCLTFESNSSSPVLNAVYSIDWAKRLAGLPKVSHHPMVSSMVSASQRILGKPIAIEMLKALVTSKISAKSPSLSDLKTVASCLLGYVGFFRFSELCSIRACDINFFPTYVSIFLESFKTDQFLDGTWVAIARSNLDTCPVKALEQYIAPAEIDLGEDLPLSRALSSSRSTSKVRRQGMPNVPLTKQGHESKRKTKTFVFVEAFKNAGWKRNVLTMGCFNFVLEFLFGVVSLVCPCCSPSYLRGF